MNNSSLRSAHSSLSTATLIAVLFAGASSQLGCGSDDEPDVEQDAGAATGTKDSGKPVTPTLPTFAMDFVVSCLDTTEGACDEFSGEKADAEKIKATVVKSCAQVGEQVKTERCPTDKLVGTCLSTAEIGGAKRWIKSFSYEPTTEAEAKSICQGNKFEAAK